MKLSVVEIHYIKSIDYHSYIYQRTNFDENIPLDRKKNCRKVILLLLDSDSSFLMLINVYTRPNFVPSLDTIGAKLRLLERIIVLSLEESIAAPIDST